PDAGSTQPPMCDDRHIGSDAADMTHSSTNRSHHCDRANEIELDGRVPTEMPDPTDRPDRRHTVKPPCESSSSRSRCG
ncbi:MAG: hypothetical protein JWN99_666, partial [Ilumatobacteraceae bacterium]|nr:hypothetical protein [Ilumatobacteraceae bacterium]